MPNLASLIETKRRKRLDAYKCEPADIHDHARGEEKVLAGGYAYRQILELVQNGADAILEAFESPQGLLQEARIEVVLRESHLYVANSGAPLSEDGVEALLLSNSSPKRGNQIGRFGLGFKSLLRLKGKIDIFSRDGSLRFDPDLCRQTIREEFKLDSNDPVPGLRIAWTPNRLKEETNDSVLGELSWATTIVRAEIRDSEILAHLREEVLHFPSPFLLFLPVAVALNLDDGSKPRRELRRKPDGEDMVLYDADSESRWRVVEKSKIFITDAAAKSDATDLHARESVPMTWAMPLDATRDEAGRFWAFFPTDTPTRLPGILNAPWKLSSDRKNLISGAWNSALMREAAKLISEHLSGLSTPSDPGRPLDAFPRRLERQDEPAAPLVEGLWEFLKDAAVISDASGGMHAPEELKLPPTPDVGLNESWISVAKPESRTKLIHPMCMLGDRLARLKELAERLRKTGKRGMTQMDAPTWFLEVASNDMALAKRVLQLANDYANLQQKFQWEKDRKLLAIIPSAEGVLCAPDNLVIAPAGVSIPGRQNVARALVDDLEALEILTSVLGVEKPDEDGWKGILHSALHKTRNSPGINKHWSDFWATLRSAPANIRQKFVAEKRAELRVRRLDGVWALSDEVLLPGLIIDAADPDVSNSRLLIDSAMHASDQDELNAIGVGESPIGTHASGAYQNVVRENADKLRLWLDHVESDYRAKLDVSNKPQSGYLRPLSLAMPKSWMLLSQVNGPANARLTRQLMQILTSLPKLIDFGHMTRPDAYTRVQVAHPMYWYVRHYGTVAIGNHAIPIETALARDCPALANLHGWDDIVSASRGLTKLVGAPNIPALNATQIKALWKALFDKFATPDAIANDRLQHFWSAAAVDKQIPEMFRTAMGDLPLTDVFVTSSANLAQRARGQGKVVVALESQVLTMWLEKGARNLDVLFRPDWDEFLTEPAGIETAVPELTQVLSEEAKQDAASRSVRGLRLIIDEKTTPIPCLYWQGMLYLDPAQLESLPRTARMKAILEEAAAAAWLDCPVEAAQRRIADSEVDKNRARVAAGGNLAERLLLAVGGRPEPLKAIIGEGASRSIPNDCTPLKIAELSIALLGPVVLLKLASALEEENLDPPKRWGSDDARTFVRALGFPEIFAASAASKREAEEFISGPIDLPPLHDFQDEVVDGLRQLVASGTGRRRAVVSLPTGGGKTRVTVQAAVDLILKPDEGKRTVLWVAQTDELCEQAVQAFRQVWINRGAKRTNLRIFRLWGGNKNPGAPVSGAPLVVIASIQTLTSRISKEDLEWLSNPGLVIVDECHHAIAPSYTGLLKWLDAEVGGQSRAEPPIVGLSATPFRSGKDDEESLRLAKRFDQRWLPHDQEKMRERLTERGILSIAAHEPLTSPTVIPPELIESLVLKSGGSGGNQMEFEKLLSQLNDLLANDEDRNRMLVETIKTSEERCIIFFANSVAHANEMAARLNLEGISAASISGETDASARRYFLDGFQHGEIRVLCNHSVLTTGFDAPKTDMVLIARQVWSPVRYMQMVGRGLRGIRNGGTERCRIVTVMDNLGRFAHKHPYHYCAANFRPSVLSAN